MPLLETGLLPAVQTNFSVRSQLNAQRYRSCQYQASEQTGKGTTFGTGTTVETAWITYDEYVPRQQHQVERDSQLTTYVRQMDTLLYM